MHRDLLTKNKLTIILHIEKINNQKIITLGSGDSMLFEGEKITFMTIVDDSIAAKSNMEINEKYIKGDYRIVTEQARFSLDSVKELSSFRYELEPSYQRRPRWSNEKKSRLIESFIMNIPVPPIFLYEYELSYYEVMDGKQRISALTEFYKDVFPLEGLDYWKELNGKKYSDLPEKIQQGIDRRYLSATILLYESAHSDEEKARSLKRLVFERINSGGVKLSYQESRNALHDGAMNQLCISLSENENFKLLWGLEAESTDYTYASMQDVEYVLRFFANRQRSSTSSKILKVYLDEYLRNANEFSIELLKKLEEHFTSVMYEIVRLMGGNAIKGFRKKMNGEIIQGNIPSVMMYEALSLLFSEHYEEILEIEPDQGFYNCIAGAVKKEFRMFEGRNTDFNYLKQRVAILYNSIACIIR